MRSSYLVQGMCTVGALLSLLGCGQQQKELEAIKTELQSVKESLNTELKAIKKNQTEMGALLTRVNANTEQTTSPVLYEIFDSNRAKAVGYLTSDVPIVQGDRVFLGDDLWDVKFVKVFTKSTGKAPDDTPRFVINRVQVLAEFGGKASDPSPKK